jgi:hypothetical protein
MQNQGEVEHNDAITKLTASSAALLSGLPHDTLTTHSAE